MKITAEMIVDIEPSKFSSCISRLTESSCEIQKVEIISKEGKKTRYSIDLIYTDGNQFKRCVSSITESPDFTVYKIRNYMDDIISGGFIEIKNSMKIDSLADYEMNVLGASQIAIEKIYGNENPSSATGIWKNIGIITGMKKKNERNRGLHYASYAESEIASAILARFTGKNGFPIIVSYDFVEDFLKIVSSLEPTFSAYRITHTDDDDNPDIFSQIHDAVSIPVISRTLDELPIFILAAVLRLSRKHKFRVKDSTVGFIGLDVSALRLSKLLSRIGFLRVLGYDNNEKTMLHFERTGGLATTPEHIFGNSDIVILLKEQFAEDDLSKIRPGNILISTLEESDVTDIFEKKKVCREIISGKWADSSILIPGLISGLVETGDTTVKDDSVIEIAEMLASFSEDKVTFPSVFSDIHEKVIGILKKKK
jgi:hypothetical protein